MKSSYFTTYEEFWLYCQHECWNGQVGCANGCAHRHELKLPPFGGRYIMEGKIEEKE